MRPRPRVVAPDESLAREVQGPGTPAIGDIDGDGRQNVVIGSGSCDFRGFQTDPDVRRCYTVYAFSEDGPVLPVGWPPVRG